MRATTFHPARQRGISLVMAMLMLVVLSMIAVSATYSTNSSLRIVGNMQLKDEALTAAQAAIDGQLDSLANFTAPAASTMGVDVNRDGTVDYQVTLNAPECFSSTPKPGYSQSVAGSAPNSTYWEISAEVRDPRTGASVTLVEGTHIDLLPYQGCL